MIKIWNIQASGLFLINHLNQLNMELKYRKPNYGRILLAGLIDAALLIAQVVGFIYWTRIALLLENPNASFWIGFISIRFISILLFNATLGMKVMTLVFLNGAEGILTIKEKFLASIFVLFRGVDYNQEVRVSV